MHSTQGPSASHPRARKYRRYDLEFPVFLKSPLGDAAREVQGVSKNVSLGGLLVKATDQLPLTTPVNFTMEVAGPHSRRPVRLSAEGRVVRVESLGDGAGYAIAVKCKTPMVQIGRHLE